MRRFVCMRLCASDCVCQFNQRVFSKFFFHCFFLFWCGKRDWIYSQTQYPPIKLFRKFSFVCTRVKKVCACRLFSMKCHDRNFLGNAYSTSCPTSHRQTQTPKFHSAHSSNGKWKQNLLNDIQTAWMNRMDHTDNTTVSDQVNLLINFYCWISMGPN